MKEYDLVIVGTGSAMNLLDPYLENFPESRVAVIDKDEPGGICLTRGCIPTKLLVHVADVVRTIESAGKFGITAPIQRIDFARVMARMRHHVDGEIDGIRQGLKAVPQVDYYAEAARFVGAYEFQVGKERIRGKTVLLCTGSKPLIPDIEGLDKIPYHTSDTILHVKERPASMVIVGGGYIAAEFGHFFSAMGTKVTILGRNQRFLHEEEPEVSGVVLKQMRKHMDIQVGCEVKRVEKASGGLRVHGRTPNGPFVVEAETLLLAAGRSSNSDVLDPAKGGVDADKDGWIKTNGFLETSKANVWAFGDANGKLQFKHKANHESIIVWRNAFGDERVAARYDAVPRAVFTDPQVASVGLGEADAIKEYGKEEVILGMERYQDTAKGKAMASEDHFVKVVVRREDLAILGAHIVGPEASTLIQSIINLLYVEGATAETVFDAMHIHPALPEVVQRAFSNLETVAEYHDRLSRLGLA